ncbi:hypothetical protein PanWU01x14_364290, partial [Parasponia andersonii]
MHSRGPKVPKTTNHYQSTQKQNKNGTTSSKIGKTLLTCVGDSAVAMAILCKQ